MTNLDNSIELSECLEYVDRAVDELPFHGWDPGKRPPAFVIPEGFEERSLAALETMANRGTRLPKIIIGRYVRDRDLNRQYRRRFEALAQEVAPDAWQVVDNHDDGAWVEDALARIQPGAVALDITGLSNRGLFGALDALSSSHCDALIVYSEPAQYWPTRQEWGDMSPNSIKCDELAERTDEREWLYSRNFHVQLVQDHEGYVVAGSAALVAFLPFKAARLAAVMNYSEYSQYLFIAGQPREDANSWRLEALMQINKAATKQWPILKMKTFGYKNALAQLAGLLFSPDALSTRYDVHVAPMGSKLQTVACWALSRMTRSITMVTAAPTHYFPTRYSDGVGTSWIFPLLRPQSHDG